eukprot:9275560-Pyramimonas_sp.AAC.1
MAHPDCEVEGRLAASTRTREREGDKDKGKDKHKVTRGGIPPHRSSRAARITTAKHGGRQTWRCCRA